MKRVWIQTLDEAYSDFEYNDGELVPDDQIGVAVRAILDAGFSYECDDGGLAVIPPWRIKRIYIKDEDGPAADPKPDTFTVEGFEAEWDRETLPLGDNSVI